MEVSAQWTQRHQSINVTVSSCRQAKPRGQPPLLLESLHSEIHCQELLHLAEAMFLRLLRNEQVNQPVWLPQRQEDRPARQAELMSHHSPLTPFFAQ